MEVRVQTRLPPDFFITCLAFLSKYKEVFFFTADKFTSTFFKIVSAFFCLTFSKHYRILELVFHVFFPKKWWTLLFETLLKNFDCTKRLPGYFPKKRFWTDFLYKRICSKHEGLSSFYCITCKELQTIMAISKI